MRPIAFLVLTIICTPLFVSAQGSFQNLDFEAANISPGTPAGGIIAASQGIPGWSTSNNVVFDGVSGGGDFVSIIDPNLPGNISPLHGTYSVVLFGGGPLGTPASISQTGLVPANARSIEMDLASSLSPAPFVVTLGGQQITMVPLETLPHYTVYGGDISAYAGQVENLTITELSPPPPEVPPSALELDDIVFSPNGVPEPTTRTLLFCGASAFALRRRYKK